MRLEYARQLLPVQVDFGGSDNHNSARLILAEVHNEHGQGAADQRIRELHLDRAFRFELGTEFTAPGR